MAAFGHIEKGGFHKWLGKPAGAPITQADIEKGLAAGGHAAKMANFARNAKRGFKKQAHKDAGESNRRHASKLYGGKKS